MGFDREARPLRTALVSAVKQISNEAPGAGELRAEQLLAGRALLEWQVDLALNLGCERIICLCEAASSIIIAQQRRVEAAGFAFHTVRGPLQLAGLVRDEDALIVQLDGLFVASAISAELLAPSGELRRALWTLPANHPLCASFPDDFERIDRERHWAGLAIVPGECARGLGELPGDSEAVSMLLRLALQAKTQCRGLSSAQLEADDLFLVSDTQAVERRGEAILDAGLAKPHWAGPGTAIATVAVRKTASSWLGKGSEISGIAALGLGLVGAGLAGAGYGAGFGAAGLCLAGLGAFAATMSASAGTMRSTIAGVEPGAVWKKALPIVMAALAIVALTLANTQSDGWLLRASLAILAVGIAWLCGQSGSTKARAFWRDTPVHMLILACAAGFGVLEDALLVLSLGGLLTLVFLTLALRAGRQ